MHTREKIPINYQQAHIPSGASSHPFGSKLTTPREQAHNPSGASSQRGVSRRDFRHSNSAVSPANCIYEYSDPIYEYSNPIYEYSNHRIKCTATREHTKKRRGCLVGETSSSCIKEKNLFSVNAERPCLCTWTSLACSSPRYAPCASCSCGRQSSRGVWLSPYCHRDCDAPGSR